MITVVEDPRIAGYCAVKGDLAYFVTVDPAGAVVPAGGPPDRIPTSVARAVEAFARRQAILAEKRAMLADDRDAGLRMIDIEETHTLKRLAELFEGHEKRDYFIGEVTRHFAEERAKEHAEYQAGLEALDSWVEEGTPGQRRCRLFVDEAVAEYIAEGLSEDEAIERAEADWNEHATAMAEEEASERWMGVDCAQNADD